MSKEMEGPVPLYDDDYTPTPQASAELLREDELPNGRELPIASFLRGRLREARAMIMREADLHNQRQIRLQDAEEENATLRAELEQANAEISDCRQAIEDERLRAEKAEAALTSQRRANIEYERRAEKAEAELAAAQGRERTVYQLASGDMPDYDDDSKILDKIEKLLRPSQETPLATAQGLERWIPVSERLPERAGTYLVLDAEHANCQALYMNAKWTVDILSKLPRRGQRLNYVTHWRWLDSSHRELLDSTLPATPSHETPSTKKGDGE